MIIFHKPTAPAEPAAEPATPTPTTPPAGPSPDKPDPKLTVTFTAPELVWETVAKLIEHALIVEVEQGTPIVRENAASAARFYAALHAVGRHITERLHLSHISRCPDCLESVATEMKAGRVQNLNHYVANAADAHYVPRPIIADLKLAFPPEASSC